MNHPFRAITVFICLIVLSTSLSADPWFTGPLLAPAGHTVPRGHTNIEIYALDVFTDGVYNGDGHLVHLPMFRSVVANPIFTHGYTDWLDVQLSIPYSFNTTHSIHYNRLADVSLGLGFQLWEQKGDPKRMDVRFLLQETIPTGRYEYLNPSLAGTDSTGLGSYQTLLGLNLQYLIPVFDTHYLRTRLIFSQLYASRVKVHGLNSYGGTPDTDGQIRPGSETGVDLAFEYTLTQNWVAVMEGTIYDGKATRFNGRLNIGPIGNPQAHIGFDNYKEKALAPALEYNFNSNIGLIGGVWFPVSGNNTSHYMTYVLALNAFW